MLGLRLFFDWVLGPSGEFLGWLPLTGNVSLPYPQNKGAGRVGAQAVQGIDLLNVSGAQHVQ